MLYQLSYCPMLLLSKNANEFGGWDNAKKAACCQISNIGRHFIGREIIPQTKP